MSKLFGDRHFYRMLLAIMVPIFIQNVITNFVSLLDNIMVGQLGTEQMSGVAIANHLLFVFNLCVVGGLSGAGIFTAQYFGKKDNTGIQNSIRSKIWIVLFLILISYTVLLIGGKTLILSFLHEGEEALDLQATYNYATGYLKIMYLQIPLFAFSNLYSTTLRECGETRLPLKASISAVVTNLVFNYLLIYGKLGFPRLGVYGAAIATVISRIVELVLVASYSHKSTIEFPFFLDLYKSLYVPKQLIVGVIEKGSPLLINEFLWSSGMAKLVQLFSLLGLEVVSAENISTTVSNIFFCSFLSIGIAISIIIGQLLGAGELEKAVDYDRKCITFSVLLCAVIGLIMIVIAPYIPMIYETSESVMHLATSFIIITAIMMPSNAFTCSCYFTMRSGGRSWITLLFDSVYLWIIAIPLVYMLIHNSTLSIVQIYAISYFIDIIKCIIGYILVHRKTWVINLVKEI